MLDNSKRHIYLNRLNFLGYFREFSEERKSLRTVRYEGVYKNEYVTLDHKGLLPSLSKILNLPFL